MPPQTVLKTLLMTDLVDSTRIVESVGDYRSMELFERHDHIARDLLVKHQGLEIDKTDGFLLLFDRPIDAVLYALALHSALTDLSGEFGLKVTARAAVHLGEVMLRENDPQHVARGAKPIEVEGLAKPMTARLMSLAQGNQTLMTRSAFDVGRRAAVGHPQVPDNLEWLDHGVYKFKGIADSQPVCEVGRIGSSPLAPPPNSEKAWRVSTHDTSGPSGWRPAPGATVPTRRRWQLRRKVAEGEHGEVWLVRNKHHISSVDATIGADENLTETAGNDERAFLFWLKREGETPETATSSWQVSDPIACVVITSGEQLGTFAVLTGKPLSCGRDEAMDLRIVDPKVSRRHFEIRRQDEGFVIQELQSRNGVHVNDERIQGEQLLHNADAITAGTTSLVFYEDNGSY